MPEQNEKQKKEKKASKQQQQSSKRIEKRYLEEAVARALNPFASKLDDIIKRQEDIETRLKIVESQEAAKREKAKEEEESKGKEEAGD